MVSLRAVLLVAILSVALFSSPVDARGKGKRSKSKNRRGSSFANPEPGDGGSRSKRTNLGEEGVLPSRTSLDRYRSRAARSTPSGGSELAAGGSWDPFAVTGRHTYGNIPGQGFGYLANQQASLPWFMPHSQPWNECDPAIHKHCSTSRGQGMNGSPFPPGGFGFAAQYASPSGWWTFHPAMSIRGTADPIPSPVAAPQHPLSHYWGLMHPATSGLQFAGPVNPNQAFYAAGAGRNGAFNPTAGAAFGFGGLGNPLSGFSSPYLGANHAWVGPAAIAANPYQDHILNRYPQNMLSAAPLASDAGAFGPFAFAPPHILGSSFLPPHISNFNSVVTNNGEAPASPFDAAPGYKVLEQNYKSTLRAIPFSSASTTAPFLSGNPNNVKNNNVAQNNNAINSFNGRKNFRTDRMAPGPSFAAQKPAPDGP